MVWRHFCFANIIHRDSGFRMYENNFSKFKIKTVEGAVAKIKNDR